ncbi:MAG: efflux RND transporter periplasmic adaptor subunit [Pseudomonadota bacterium]
MATGQAAAQQAAPPEVEISEPFVRRIVDFELYTGQFYPVQSVTIQSRVTGHLQAIHFEEGALVEEGDLLFEIDPRPLQAALAQAEAQVEVAKAAQWLAEARNERASELLDRRVGTAAEADTTRAELAQAVANVTLAEAQAETARLDVEFTRITAPISGRVSSAYVDIGNLVTTSIALTSIVSLDPIEFRFQTSEADYLRYSRLSRDGSRPSSRTFPTRVSVRLTGEDNWDRKGRMSFVDNRLDSASGTIEGRALFDNEDLFLTPGVYGRLRLPASGEYDAILIPDEAVVSDQARKIVYVLNDEDVVAERVVELGPMHHNLRVVRNGLSPGERFVVRGLQRVRDGARVTPNSVEIVLDQSW